MMPAASARVDLVTPAGPDQGVPRFTRARRKAAALGIVGALLVPLPAAAAPAPCDQALRYAAQSGTRLMRIGNLDLGPAGRTDRPIKDIGVGDAESALIAQTAVNAAALGRVLDGGPVDRKALAEVVRQTAPPAHKQPERRAHAATEAGPFRLGASELAVHARWDPGMACGNVAGEATRAEARLRRTGVPGDGDVALVRVPGRISGLSTTAMERHGPAARAVAAASMAGGDVELLGGAIRITMVTPPSLLAMMSGTDGGEVRYRPAVIEVSGEGFETARLDTAGDSVELRLDRNGEPVPERGGAGPDGETGDTTADDGVSDRTDKAGAARADRHDTGAGSAGSDIPRKPPALPGNPDDGGSGDSAGGLPFAPAPALPLPSIPAAPPLTDPAPGAETAPASGPGTTVAISLGDVRQAVSGHAVAAKVTAMTIAISKGPDRQAYADSAPTRSGVALDFDMGLLEAAAVAPEPAGGASSVVGGDGGGLPVTGPRVDVMALTGIALLIAGAAALIFGLRGRPRP